MSPSELTDWRKRERQRLIAARLALDAGTLERRRLTIDAHLRRAFPGLATAKLALCWPIKAEYDARHLAKALRAQGATTCLPVVVARGQPLEFREWHPGTAMAVGPLDIPYPAESPAVMPDAVLLPMNGWDDAGYRLGYGGGYFDRTLAALEKRPAVIGVSYELARMDSIHPQAWDIPVDWVVTERGVYRRDQGRLAFLGAPPAGEPSALASPVCYAGEIAPGYFGAAER
jgi:5,10-methenyltetrahydrofolate synthetase